MLTLRLLGLAFWILGLSQPALSNQKVELELVLAIDTSTSVDEDEFILQRTGIAEAFRHPKVLRAIEGLGPSGMAVSVVQWAGASKQVTSVDWTFVNNQASSFALAGRIEDMERSLTGFTDIAGAINASARSLMRNRFDGQRLAIDVSGDGTSDRNNPATARDAAILQGITINGLVIYSVEYDLGDLARFELHRHYKQQVIGGPGAFLMEATSFKTFAVSMREKLYQEISGPLFAQTSID